MAFYGNRLANSKEEPMKPWKMVVGVGILMVGMAGSASAQEAAEEAGREFDRVYRGIWRTTSATIQSGC